MNNIRLKRTFAFLFLILLVVLMSFSVLAKTNVKDTLKEGWNKIKYGWGEFWKYPLSYVLNLLSIVIISVGIVFIISKIGSNENLQWIMIITAILSLIIGLFLSFYFGRYTLWTWLANNPNMGWLFWIFSFNGKFSAVGIVNIVLLYLGFFFILPWTPFLKIYTKDDTGEEKKETKMFIYITLSLIVGFLITASPALIKGNYVEKYLNDNIIKYYKFKINQNSNYLLPTKNKYIWETGVVRYLVVKIGGGSKKGCFTNKDLGINKDDNKVVGCPLLKDKRYILFFIMVVIFWALYAWLAKKWKLKQWLEDLKKNVPGMALIEGIIKMLIFIVIIYASIEISTIKAGNNGSNIILKQVYGLFIIWFIIWIIYKTYIIWEKSKNKN